MTSSALKATLPAVAWSVGEYGDGKKETGYVLKHSGFICVDIDHLPEGYLYEKCLLYSSEDDYARIVKPRLKVAGAKLENIPWLNWMDTPRDDLDYGLFVVDPIVDIVDGGNINDAATVRKAIHNKLQPFLDYGTAVLGVHHNRKGFQDLTDPTQNILGSGAWTAVARHIIQCNRYLKKMHPKKLKTET